MSLEKYEDFLELLLRLLLRLDNESCVKTNVHVIRAVKLDRYFSYSARVSHFKS